MSDTEKKRDSTSHSKSTHSGLPASGSKEHWKQPRTIMEFAQQVNTVCSRLLNEEIDMETAKTYSALARVVTQAANIEVARARLSKDAPRLGLEGSHHE